MSIKKQKVFVITVLTFLAFFLSADPVLANAEKEVTPTKIWLSGYQDNIDKGQTLTIKATVEPYGYGEESSVLPGAKQEVEWALTETQYGQIISTTSNTVVVQGIEYGSFTVTATIPDYPDVLPSYTVINVIPYKENIKDEVSDQILSSAFSLSPSNIRINIGDSADLKAQIIYSNNKVVNVSDEAQWSVDNPRVLAVNTNGTVRGLTTGTATITAIFNGMSTSARVTVKERSNPPLSNLTGGSGSISSYPVPTPQIPAAVSPASPTVKVSGISFSQSSGTLESGKTLTLSPLIKPSNASNKSVSWKSSNQAIATVSPTGTVTAKKKGTAIITVTTVDGSKSATYTLTVTDSSSGPIKVKSIKLSTAATLEVGKTQKLTASINPVNASNQKVSWKSSDPSVATVSSNGTITAKKKGTTTVTVTTADGFKRATCKVTVEENSNPAKITETVEAKEVKLNKTTAILFKGSRLKLTATVIPREATDKKVIWKSSNPSVASVSPTGTITAKQKGSVTITATTTDGSTIATCKITVK